MPDIDLDSFRASVLAPWAEDRSSAFKAASEALHLATVVHAKQKATVLVTVPDSSAQRRVLQYLEAFFTDQPALFSLRPSFKDDTVTVKSVRVMVLPQGSSRRPRGVVATVVAEVETNAPAANTELPSDEELFGTAQHIMLVTAGRYATATDIKVADDVAAILGFTDAADYCAQLREYHAARWQEEKASTDPHPGLHAGSSLESLIAPTKSRTLITEQKAPCRPLSEDERVTSSAFEYERMLNQGKNEMNGNQSEPPLIGPRRWKRD